MTPETDFPAARARGYNVEALTNLRRVAADAPPDRLHMRRWFERAGCGTAYCLAGWAALDPWMAEHTPIRTGFDVEPLPDAPGRYRVAMAARPGDGRDIFDWLGTDVIGIGHRNAAALFGAGLHLEGDPHAVRRETVLGRLDALLAGGDIEPYDAVLNQYGTVSDDPLEEWETDCGPFCS